MIENRFIDRNVIVLCSFGKETSVLLDMICTEFRCYDVGYIDTGFELSGMDEFRSLMQKKYGFKLIRIVGDQSKNPSDGTSVCCMSRRFSALATINYGKIISDRELYGAVCPVTMSDVEIWMYIKEHGLEFNPLYLAKNGRRYEEITCGPCSTTIASNADCVEDIIEELKYKRRCLNIEECIIHHDRLLSA